MMKFLKAFFMKKSFQKQKTLGIYNRKNIED